MTEVEAAGLRSVCAALAEVGVPDTMSATEAVYWLAERVVEAPRCDGCDHLLSDHDATGTHGCRRGIDHGAAGPRQCPCPRHRHVEDRAQIPGRPNA